MTPLPRPGTPGRGLGEGMATQSRRSARHLVRHAHNPSPPPSPRRSGERDFARLQGDELHRSCPFAVVTP